jgi:hypothetical protein
LLIRGLNKTWVWIVAVFIMIGTSRLYLGVHFPSDVVLGWIVGALTLWFLLLVEKPALEWFRRFSPLMQSSIAFAASLALILITVLSRISIAKWTIPPTWIRMAKRLPNAERFQPLALSWVITPAAAFFGLVFGAILLDRRGWMDTSGSFWQRLARYLIGLAGVIILWFGLDLIFPSGEAFVPYLFRYVRYALVGIWISFLAPLVFFRLKLLKLAND